MARSSAVAQSFEKPLATARSQHPVMFSQRSEQLPFRSVCGHFADELAIRGFIPKHLKLSSHVFHCLFFPVDRFC